MNLHCPAGSKFATTHAWRPVGRGRARKESQHAVSIKNNSKHPICIMPTDIDVLGALWSSGCDMRGCMQIASPHLGKPPCKLRWPGNAGKSFWGVGLALCQHSSQGGSANWSESAETCPKRAHFAPDFSLLGSSGCQQSLSAPKSSQQVNVMYIRPCVMLQLHPACRLWPFLPPGR